VLFVKSFAPIAAITLDLDDTLWPVLPALVKAEQALHRWLEAKFPEAARHYSAERMRALRDQVWQAHPHLQHDFSAVRLISLRQALEPYGANENDIEDAFEVLFSARNQVDLFPNVLQWLTKLSAHLPLVSISNGNADLSRIGIARYFTATVQARQVGFAKPDARIFEAAIAKLGIAPEHVLHIGDHAEQDVCGAKRAGLQAAWIGEDPAVFEALDCRPNARATSFDALCSQLFPHVLV
jgi:FMN hydrolase / 5-amino-6-(5-phospho-D-ribitylamino)uracil phosphatase